jgi:ssDNA-specific exonuclease RecJ
MIVKFFPDRLIHKDACFGLSRADNAGADLPVFVEGDAATPFHIIHTDPDYLAYFTALIILQAWTYGISDSGPTLDRKPVLVVTDRPGHFAESYLRIQLPAEKVKAFCQRRRVSLGEKNVSIPVDKATYWDHKIDLDSGSIKFHNLFPAYQVLHAEATPRPIDDREYLGRGDESGPALLITRKAERENLCALHDKYDFLLGIFDLHGVSDWGLKMPLLYYHKSIFAPVFTRLINSPVIAQCLPDSKFDHFCSQSKINVLIPEENEELAHALGEIDSALQALLARMDQRRDIVVVQVFSSAQDIRNILLSLPIGIEQYENALRMSAPESLWFACSITQPLEALEGRLPEMAHFGEWEEFLLQSLVENFRKIVSRLMKDSPKRQLMVDTIEKALNQNRGVAIIVNRETVAKALRVLLRLPTPFGFNVSSERVVVITQDELKTVDASYDCVMYQVFDPHVVFTELGRREPRDIFVILQKTELRFMISRLQIAQKMFPDHLAHKTILQPFYQLIEQLDAQPSQSIQRPPKALFTEAEFKSISRLFSDGDRTGNRGMVLVDDTDSDAGYKSEMGAQLVYLAGNRVVLLSKEKRVSYVNFNDNIAAGTPDELQRGYRLIIINPSARELIAHRILSVTQDTAKDGEPEKLIERWRKELSGGINHLGFSREEVLRRMRLLGSQRISPIIVGQWVKGDVLGPLDAQDILRAGQVVESDWISDNWKQIGFALAVIRSGHRLLGRQITRIIQKAAIGDYELKQQEEYFLRQIGISVGELQDAVTLLTVESVSDESQIVPVDQIGKVISL